jgi:hypothetical protein
MGTKELRTAVKKAYQLRPEGSASCVSYANTTKPPRQTGKGSTHTHTHKHTQTRTQTRTHTHTNTHTQTHTQTHTHKHRNAKTTPDVFVLEIFEDHVHLNCLAFRKLFICYSYNFNA